MIPFLSRSISFGLFLLVGVASTFGKSLDNFNDNQKTGWTDFSFNPPLGVPTEKNGQFLFAMPPVNQAIFSASTKTTETFTLKEGRTVEFRVDLVSGNGKDAFAVLAFIPTSSSASTLGGYGFAKSTTDILITKGIAKYFYNENPTPAIKNENVTLVLSMTGLNGNVIITGKVLDKDDNDAVLFEKTVIDTPAADVLSDGKDDPAAPYLTEGRFVLYLYEDFDQAAPQDSYEVIYDNAETFVLDKTLVDDFNDNTKTGWTDFSFNPPLGFPTEKDAQFVFTMPPVNQAIFSASTKTSPSFDLVDGTKLEFQVDLVSGNGKDAFAVLSFAPKGSSPSTLAGYGIAKSTTDILITKGIGKYFYNENPTPAIKNENVTLVLSLTAAGPNVIITGKVLDKDDNNAVLFEKTFIDTPAADVLSDGTDNPSAPYLGSGNIVLYLYEDFDQSAPQDSYEVIYDNLTAFAPPAASNQAPVISDLLPVNFANFIPTNSTLTFKVTDDKALAADKITVDLNGKVYKQGSGLTISGTGAALTASLAGLEPNANYVANLRAEDSEGVAVTSTLYFDTFSKTAFSIEVEDYNFNGGEFIDNPVPAAEGVGGPDSYNSLQGVAEIDFSDTRTSPRNNTYREIDPVTQGRSLDNLRDKYKTAGGPDAGVYDYDISEPQAGEFLNYTRTFPAGTYEIYLREALVNTSQAETVLEKVTSPATQENQTTVVLGSFLGKLSGFQYRNVPLTDALGKQKTLVTLSGPTTLRLRQVTSQPSDGTIAQNYLIFIPVTGTVVQPATVSGITPTPGSRTETIRPEIQVTFLNRDTKVKESSIVLTLNGAPVSAAVQSRTNGAVLIYGIPLLPPAGSTNTARVVFQDDAGTFQTNDWTFIIDYRTVNAANSRPGPGKNPGFKVRMVQAPLGSNLENSLGRAEAQLAANSTIPAVIKTNVIEQVINFTQNELPSFEGYFEDAATIPGLNASENGSDDIALEIQTWLQLSAGIHRFGVRCDDGYQITAGTSPGDTSTAPLAFHNGGPADEQFDFVVRQSGFYPFRMVWYERASGAHVEWFSVDRNTGEKTLINDPAVASSIKAFTEVDAPATRLFSSATVKGPFTVETGATINAGTKTITIAPQGNARFYIVEGQSKVKIVGVSGGTVTLGYE